MTPKVNQIVPTVLLVHGAFADSSSWAGVVTRLQTAGVKVIAVSNPLRGLSYDGEYVSSVAKQIEGLVLLVGHSYGSPVITYAASKAGNVKGLVFISVISDFFPSIGFGKDGTEYDENDVNEFVELCGVVTTWVFKMTEMLENIDYHRKSLPKLMRLPYSSHKNLPPKWETKNWNLTLRHYANNQCQH